MKQYTATVIVTDMFVPKDRLDMKRSLEEARIPEGLSLRVQSLQKMAVKRATRGRSESLTARGRD